MHASFSVFGILPPLQAVQVLLPSDEAQVLQLGIASLQSARRTRRYFLKHRLWYTFVKQQQTNHCMILQLMVTTLLSVEKQ